MVEKTAKYASRIINNSFRFLMKPVNATVAELEDAVDDFREEASVYGGIIEGDGSLEFSFLPSMNRDIADLPNYEKVLLNKNDLNIARMFWFIDEKYPSRIAITRDFLDSVRAVIHDKNSIKKYDDIIALITVVILGIDEEWITKEYLSLALEGFHILLQERVLDDEIIVRVPDCTNEMKDAIRNQTIDIIFTMVSSALSDIEFLSATKYVPLCLNMKNEMVVQFVTPMIERFSKEINEKKEYLAKEIDELKEVRQNPYRMREYIENMIPIVEMAESIGFALPNDKVVKNSRHVIIYYFVFVINLMHDFTLADEIEYRNALLERVKVFSPIAYHYYMGSYPENEEQLSHLRYVCDDGIQQAFQTYVDGLRLAKNRNYDEIKRVCELGLSLDITLGYDLRSLYYALGEAYECGSLSYRDYKKAISCYESAFRCEIPSNMSMGKTMDAAHSLARIYYFKYDADMYAVHWLTQEAILCELHGYKFANNDTISMLIYFLEKMEDPIWVLPLVGICCLRSEEIDGKLLEALEKAGYYYDGHSRIYPKNKKSIFDINLQYNLLTRLYTKEYLLWNEDRRANLSVASSLTFSEADKMRNKILEDSKSLGKMAVEHNLKSYKEQVTGNLTNKDLYRYQNACLILMSESELEREKYLIFLGDAYLADGKEKEAYNAYKTVYYIHGEMEHLAATKVLEYFINYHPDYLGNTCYWVLLVIGAYLKTGQNPREYLNSFFYNGYFEVFMGNTLVYDIFQAIYLRYDGEINDIIRRTQDYYKQEWIPEKKCYISRKFSSSMNDMEESVSHFWENVTPNIGDYLRVADPKDFKNNIEDVFLNRMRDIAKEELESKGFFQGK